ncbi:MAG: response regulator transcription factor [Christensenellaceae bacterium]|jgi:two-component system alkaline phosphatase synthesis response regulator PhoP
MANILIVEDEKAIHELLYKSLTLVGHQCKSAYDGREALDFLAQEAPDLILLDLMLPEIDGFMFMQMRQQKETPVIMITAKHQLHDRIAGFDAGADDYIVKPFEILEVIARVQAVLRRANKQEAAIQIGEVQIDFLAREASIKAKKIELTPQEFLLLEVLVQHKNMALSREQLLELAWGFDYLGDTRTVDVHIQKLRKKLFLHNEIKTVYKMGYRLEVRT